jgi:hypothetical protein
MAALANKHRPAQASSEFLFILRIPRETMANSNGAAV